MRDPWSPHFSVVHPSLVAGLRIAGLSDSVENSEAFHCLSTPRPRSVFEDRASFCELSEPAVGSVDSSGVLPSLLLMLRAVAVAPVRKVRCTGGNTLRPSS